METKQPTDDSLQQLGAPDSGLHELPRPLSPEILETAVAARNADDVAHTSTAAPTVKLEVKATPLDKSNEPSIPAGSSSTEGLTTPGHIPIKRFNAVNINKRFLEKNSTLPSTTSNHGSQSSTSVKVVSSPVAPQASATHSRLVTAKLTANSGLSSLTSHGWSRPTSTSPSVSQPTPTIAAPNGRGVPMSTPSHISGASPSLKGPSPIPQAKEGDINGLNRPAWSTVKPLQSRIVNSSQDEFPTAAEASKGSRSTSTAIPTPTPVDPVNAAHKRAMLETANAFRGVHLDPKGHHWDEEEDDNDFLGDVVEFGDGTQYQVDGSSVDPGDKKPEASATPDHLHLSERPVSKEERFVEDFDRSWPKSRGTAITTRDPTRNGPIQGDINVSPVSAAPTISSASSVLSHSRVLFNERLNRMEPYSHSHKFNGSGPVSSHSSWRGSHQEEHRHDQVVSDHVTQQDVYLLHRESRLSYSSVAATPGSDEQGHRIAPIGEKLDSSPGSTDSTSRSSLSHLNHLVVTAGPDEPSRVTDAGTAYPKFDGVSPGHSQTVTNGRVPRQGWPTRETPAEDIPDKGKSNTLISQRSAPNHQPDDSRKHSYELAYDNPSTGGATAQVAERSSGSDEKQSSLQGADTADQDSLRKAFLHASAERAKERRRQEEEERQKAAERAKQKALELETKMKIPGIADSSSAHDDPALVVTVSLEKIQEKPQVTLEPTVRETEMIEEDITKKAGLGRSHTVINGHPSRPGVNQFGPDSAFPRSSVHDKVEQSGSWRTRETEASAKLNHASQSKVHNALVVTPRVVPPLKQVENFNLQPEDGLQVVDFSDLSSLVDHSSSNPSTQTSNTSPNSTLIKVGPLGGDSLGLNTPGVAILKSPADLQLDWRSKPHTIENQVESSSSHKSVVDNTISTHSDSRTEGPDIPPLSLKSTTPQDSLTHALSSGPNNSAKTKAFKEVSMSTLNDTMSRIKGALDGMQAPSIAEQPLERSTALHVGSPISISVTRPSPSNEGSSISRWIPPALRQPATLTRAAQLAFEPTVASLVFIQPVPPVFVVSLPRMSTVRETLTRRQLNLWRLPSAPMRWDILSWDPPVDGMYWQNLSLNEVLFKTAEALRSRVGYRVMFPKATSKSTSIHTISSQIDSPKITVHLGVSQHPRPSAGAFGRLSTSDAANWRQIKVSMDDDSSRTLPQLDVVSRSPPPQPPYHPSLGSDDQVHQENAEVSSKTKAQSKMPANEDVAFHRDIRKNLKYPESGKAVSFLVQSELDDTSLGLARLTSQGIVPSPTVSTAPGSSRGHATKLEPSRNDFSEVFSASSKAPLLSSDSSKDLYDTQKPMSSSDYASHAPSVPSKDLTTTTRAPDPEHLKAVWSQPSADIKPGVNSLEGISDDLAAVPFSLHEVKSDDGGTPPPVRPSPTPSRMSALEVTRAFQVVPSTQEQHTSSSRGFHFTQPPPSPMVYSGRPSGSAGPHSSLNGGVRPSYTTYSSPMSAHSPSPTLLYPQQPPLNHIPNTAFSYSPTIWMPLSQAISHPHPHQPAGSQVRTPPAGSPYDQTLMSYSATNNTQVNVMGSSNHHPPSHHPTGHYPNGLQSRVAMMSPVMPQSTPVHHQHVPVYGASPVMMHTITPPIAATASSQTFPNSSSAPNRGHMPMRTAYDNRAPVSTVTQPQSGGSRYTNQASAYNPMAPSFMRPSW